MIHVDPSNISRTFTNNDGKYLDFPLFSIGKGSYINSMEISKGIEDDVVNIQIGNFCSVAYNVKLLINRNHDYKLITTSPYIYNGAISTSGHLPIKKKLKQKGQIIIGNDVWIGNDVIILSGVNIGNGAVIGAGTIVAKDVPPYAIVAGNPQRIIKYRFEEEQIKKLQKIKWWNWNNEDINKNLNCFGDDINHFIDKFYYKDEKVKSISMKKNRNTFLFIPDFNEKYGIWENVIKEYIETFSVNMDVSLLLRIPNDIELENNINKVQNLLVTFEVIPDILIINDNLESDKQLFTDIDYFITNRSINTIRYWEYCNEFGVKIISGVDNPIFDINLIK